MRTAFFLSVPLALLLAGCGSEPKPAAAPAPVKKAVIKPLDERHRFPRDNQVKTEVADEHALGKDYLPGGNIAHYQKGKQSWDLLLIRASDASASALLLLDYKKKLDGAEVLPSFGGFYGKDGDKPTFIFAKNAWLCGVIGLPKAEADAVAREFAARLP